MAAVGHMQAVVVADTLYCSGQIPLDPATGEIVAGGFADQAARVFDNLEAVVGAAGLSFDDVVKVTIYLTDLANFGALNEIYERRFREPYPARATVGVSTLPKGAQVEMDLTAVRGAGARPD